MAQNNARGINQPIPVGFDLSGILSKATVVGLRGNPISSTAPLQQQVLQWNGSAWVPTNPPYYTTYSSIYLKQQFLAVNVTTTDNQTNYTVTDTDCAIVLTGSTVTPTGQINFPATAPQGRVIMVGNVHRSTTFKINPYSGTSIDGHTSAFSLTYGAFYVCIDGTNWKSIGNWTG